MAISPSIGQVRSPTGTAPRTTNAPPETGRGVRESAGGLGPQGRAGFGGRPLPSKIAGAVDGPSVRCRLYRRQQSTPSRGALGWSGGTRPWVTIRRRIHVRLDRSNARRRSRVRRRQSGDDPFRPSDRTRCPQAPAPGRSARHARVAGLRAAGTAPRSDPGARTPTWSRPTGRTSHRLPHVVVG